MCENGGTCVDGVNEYTCNCAPDFTGEHCETRQYKLFFIFIFYLNIKNAFFNLELTAVSQAHL